MIARVAISDRKKLNGAAIAAQSYIARGWCAIAYATRTKGPTDAGWQNRTIDAAEVNRVFGPEPVNIGVLLGRRSAGLTDIDLDSAEALALAPAFLPFTGAIFGRRSKRSAHRLYVTTLAETEHRAAIRLQDPTTRSTLLELRIGGGGKAAQTVFPASTHPSGELVEWERDGEPARVDGADLVRQARRLAAAALMVRNWPRPGSRHDAGLVVGGFFARCKLSAAEAKRYTMAIAKAAGDDEAADRSKAAEDAVAALSAGKHVFGFTALSQMFGYEIAGKIAEWFGYPNDGETATEELSPIPFINISRWDDEEVPERTWAILQRVPLRQVCLFSGEGAAGKSILQLQLSVAHVLGRDWLGLHPRLGPAMFLDAEDDPTEIHIRLAAVLAHYDAKFSDVAQDLHVASLAGHDAVLAATGRSGKIEPTGRYQKLLEAAGDIKPRMIGIASSANVFAGNEIDRSQVMQFIGLLTRLAMAADGSVMLISHPSLTGINTGTGLSGNTQWHNAVRARFYLKGLKGEGEEPDTDLRELVFKKNNYGPVGQSITLRWQGGLFLPEDGLSIDQAEREAKADEVFLDLLARFSREGRTVNDKWGRGYAPAAFAEEDQARGATLHKRDLEAAMRRLFAAGKIWNEPCGKPSRPASRLAIKEST